MNSLDAFIFGGITGAIGGAIGSYFYFKKKFRADAQEEVDNLMKAINEEEPDDSEAKKKAEIAKNKPDLKTYKTEEYKDILHRTNYATVNVAPPIAEKPDESSEPEIILPDEFGMLNGYDKITLTMYSDGTITDETDRPSDDLRDSINADAVNEYFKDYDENVCYVRNDKLGIDYEIVKETLTYEEATGYGPEDE